MDAQKSEVSHSHHQSNLKRPWLGPNDHFDVQTHHHIAEIRSYSNSRAPERAREHLRAGYANGIISPEKNGRVGEPPFKKIRTSEDGSEHGLERHIFPRIYASQDSTLHERVDSVSKPALLQMDLPKNATKPSSNPSGDIGDTGQHQASTREVGEKSGERRQHKSLLITKSPSNLIGHKSNKTSSEADPFQPASNYGKSHDMQLNCNPLLQEVALGLSQLASIIRTGRNTEPETESNPTKDDRGEGSINSVKCPDVAQIGLKETLHWMLNVIQSSTHSAELKTTYQDTPPRCSPENERTAAAATSGHRLENSEGSLEIMKRRFLDDGFRRQHPDLPSEEGRRSQESRRDSTSRDSMRERRPTVEELPPMQSQSSFPQATIPHLGFVGRTPAMNPPPAPYRTAPVSPPGPPRHSPTSSYNLASPASSSAYTPQPPNPINLPSPRSLTSSSLGNLFHHPISPSSSIDATTAAAANAHTAALQHDVSIRTLALQSLQQEHNNLLAAFARSQTRAVALEKKHLVSDGEINSLSEERTRLQAQVSELEQTVEDLSRSRDEARQSAVQEGAQYVQMIKMAGQLEERGREERKAWEKMKADMERRIERLVADTAERVHLQHKKSIDGATTSSPIKADPATSATEDSEASSPPTFEAVAMSTLNINLVAELRNEIQKLRNRCAEYERALFVVRSESREIEGIITALGRAGKSVKEKVDEALVGVEDKSLALVSVPATSITTATASVQNGNANTAPVTGGS